MSPPILDLNQVTVKPITSSDEPRKLFDWKDDTTLVLRLDWSSLSAFSDCNRKGKFLLIDAITGAKSPALVFGAAVHAALEFVYNNLDMLDTDLANQRIQQVIDEEYEKHNLSMYNEYRTPEFAYECVKAYIQHYKGEKITPVMLNGTKAVEFGFAVPIAEFQLDARLFQSHGLGTLTTNAKKEQVYLLKQDVHIPVIVEWTGVVDLVADIQNQTWVVDHKTTSMLTADFTDGFEMAPQPIGYLYAVNKLLPEPARGFMLNGLVCRRPTKTGKGFEPVRRFYTYEQHHFDEWLSDIRMLIEEFINNLVSNKFPARRNMCLMKFGKCGYFDTCALAPNLRQQHIESGVYARNTWKPV